MKQLACKREFIAKFVTRQKLVIYNVGANPKSKPIRITSKRIHGNFAAICALTTMARFGPILCGRQLLFPQAMLLFVNKDGRITTINSEEKKKRTKTNDLKCY